MAVKTEREKLPQTEQLKCQYHLIISILFLIRQCVEEKRPLLMEQLPINNGCGQSFGFVLYRKHVSEPKMLTFPGKVRDRAIVSYVTF